MLGRDAFQLKKSPKIAERNNFGSAACWALTSPSAHPLYPKRLLGRLVVALHVLEVAMPRRLLHLQGQRALRVGLELLLQQLALLQREPRHPPAHALPCMTALRRGPVSTETTHQTGRAVPTEGCGGHLLHPSPSHQTMCNN